MLRLGLHLGVRQKNLRELLICPKGRLPTAERHLEMRKRGELRWNARDHGWEVLIPASAFKNRSEEHTSELQSLMRISYAVFCLTKKKNTQSKLYVTILSA